MATPASNLERGLRRDRLIILSGLLAVIVAAWGWTLAGVLPSDTTDASMAGMAMPVAAWSAGHALLLTFMWWVMMVAMMVPSAAPLVLLAAALQRRKHPGGRPELVAALVAAGYLTAWGGFSVAATLIQWGLEQELLISPDTMQAQSGLAGGLLLAAGFYQLTPLKQACLLHCRSPVDFLVAHWQPGSAGAFRAGLAHGAYCVLCCWFMMTLLFVGGVMNVLWIGGIALYVLLEKFAPGGRIVSRACGLLLACAGTVVLARSL